MTTRWRFKPFDPDRVRALSHGAGVSPLVAQILLNRGISEPRQVHEFMEARLNFLHDPELLPGVVEAADRLARAVREDRRIVIYGDYDVDGVCGTSTLWACLKLAGARHVDYYIPHRVEEGYGVNAEALRKIARDLQAEVVVTVDCGISAVAEARLARELGLEFIITDHHTPGPELPPADAIVHPRLPQSGPAYPCPDLCGAGVAFKLAWQVCKTFGDGKKASPHLRDFLLGSLSLVALATIADVVPLADENRVLVRHGLAAIDARPSVGLRALLDVAGVNPGRKLNTGNVGFALGPRINAAGRLERAMRAVEMLTTSDAELASVIAAELDQCNSRRQEIEQTIVSEAHAMIRAAGDVGDRGAIVLGKHGWHAGVIGIVASRLVDTYHRPTIIVALDDAIAQGSGRSIAGFNLYEAIQACSEGLTGFGGHAAAAGLKLPPTHFPAFALKFDLHCRETLTDAQKERVLWIDAEVQLGQLSLKTVEEIERLEPYGIGNPRPVLASNQVRIVGAPRIVGERKNHMQLRFAQGETIVKAIAWNMAERLKNVTADTICSIAYLPSINEWKGRREVQLELRDLQLDEPSPSVSSLNGSGPPH